MPPHQGFSEARPLIGSACKAQAVTIDIAQIGDEIREENMRIAERLQAHDPMIVDELILRYSSRLRGYLTRLTADRELSEDLLQETWIRVMTRGSQFKGDSQVITWIFAIARNLVFDVRRKRAWRVNLHVSRETGDELPVELPSTDKTPYEYCSDIEHTRLIAQAILTLKPGYRELIELRFQQEMSLCEIAQATGSSLSSVKTRLYRAMRLLRLKLKTALLEQPEQLRAAS